MVACIGERFLHPTGLSLYGQVAAAFIALAVGFVYAELASAFSRGL